MTDFAANRQISTQFTTALKNDGVLHPILERVKLDPDIELFIRSGYINIYFKGASLLKLTETAIGYKAEVDSKYRELLDNPACAWPLPGTVKTKDDALAWVRALPLLKDGVIVGGYACKEEIALEQLFVRVNNRLGQKVKTEMFVVDRQYCRPGTAGERIDLLGVRFPRRGQTAYPVLIEVKYGLNSDIRQMANQASRYVELVKANWAEFMADLRSMLKQRADLGLYDKESERAHELQISDSPADLEVLFLLGDYNPHSSLLDIDSPELSSQVRVGVMEAGMAFWDVERRVRWIAPGTGHASPSTAFALPESSKTNGKRYRVPTSLSTFQQDMYAHLIEWKHRNITDAPGTKGGREYDAVLPVSHAADLPHIYKPIRDTVSALPFKRHLHFDHMASSQVACLNLFLPILKSPHGAAVLKQVKKDLVELDTERLPDGFAVEYAGEGYGDKGGVLGDKNPRTGTDCDIAIAYKNKEGERCIWLIEHKLTEAEFTQCGGATSEGREPHHRCENPFDEILAGKDSCYYHSGCDYRYWDITEANRTLFAGAARLAHCPFQGGLNQLWRNQLLGLGLQAAGAFDGSCFSVVKHPRNGALGRSLSQYEALVIDREKFFCFDSGELVTAALATGDPDLRAWASWYQELYAV